MLVTFPYGRYPSNISSANWSEMGLIQQIFGRKEKRLDSSYCLSPQWKRLDFTSWRDCIKMFLIE
jgi:hypothetical protein